MLAEIAVAQDVCAVFLRNLAIKYKTCLFPLFETRRRGNLCSGPFAYIFSM